MVLNIVAGSPDWRAPLLSNFPRTPFEFEGERFASVEGFIQGIKFAPDDPRRERTFGLHGIKAKRMSRKAAKSFGRRFVWWKEQQIRWGSEKHHQLIGLAIRAKFEQSTDARQALIATGDLELVHELGHPESPTTSLPAEIFVSILTSLREELQGSDF